MISINTLQISSDKKSLVVSISTETGFVFTALNLWTEDTYKDSTKSINLSALLDSNTNDENFVITADNLSIPNFDGLYFIEFGDSNDTLQIGAVAELSTYKKCLLDNTLSILSSNTNIFTGEGCNNSEFNKLIYTHSILNGLQSSIISGYYGEAIDFINALKKFCNKCSNCGQLNSILSIGTLNNNIILL